MRMGLEYCVEHNLFPLILETDCLVVKHFFKKTWDVPWSIGMEIRRIQRLMKGLQVVLKRTFTEVNKVADFLANNIFVFVGTDSLTYSSFQQLPK